MEKTEQRFDEPKLIFTIKLIEAQEHITFLINNGLVSRAAKEIAVLLLRLNINSDEKKMLELMKNLTLENYQTFTDEQAFKAFAILCEFLNRTYFADYHKPRPREGRGTL